MTYVARLQGLRETECHLKTSRLAAGRGIRGFTYVGLLVAIVLFALGSVGATHILSSSERAERERELLFCGAQFRAAIASYYLSGPGAPRYPETLAQLLTDPRFPGVKRHLRKIFIDPVTGKAEWGLVMAPGGGIMGVHSLSEREPMKRANFEPPNEMLNLAERGSQSGTYSYRDWQFVYLQPVNPRRQ